MKSINHLDLAKLSNLVYKDSFQIECLWSKRPYEKKYKFLYKLENYPKLFSSEDDCEFFVTKTVDTLVFTFRGTSSRKDILTDLNVSREYLLLKNYDGYSLPLVHNGFLQQFLSVSNIISYKIEESYLKWKCKNVIFTGHSLGGALATISSLFFSNEFININFQCVTFGSPRVGDSIFKSFFEKSVPHSFRYVNEKDPVPCLPTSWRFSHVHGGRWFLGNETFFSNPKSRTWNAISGTLLSLFGIGYNPAKDHSCEEYIEDLEREIEKFLNKN